MAGHSHSANVKHRKDRVNALKAKVFSKIAKMVVVAARLGGGDPDSNPRLRLAIEKARAASMPKDNIQRAIKKGTGKTDGANFEELIYEGYATGGVALIVTILTDNRNRTAPEIKKLFERGGGSLGSSGSVAYMFSRKSIFDVEPDEELDEEKLMDSVIEAGADDFVSENGLVQIHADPGDFLAIKAALEELGIKLSGAEVGFVPGNRVDVESLDTARRVVRVLESLEEHDDVQSVFSNHRVSGEIAEELAKES